MAEIEKVHVIFKTHLDIGFTDLAANVTDQYVRQYIPSALALSEQLEREGDAARFVWTTGSWLIHEYFKRAGDAGRIRMEEAIRAGRIVWHGLPFTTHTELMDPSLFEYGLSLAQRLDIKYGRKTIAAKMTDVPGHTRAIVPLMAAKGIRYLHIGVNPASRVPSVPPVFVWRGKDGSEVIVNYADNYGKTLEISGLKEVMIFAHTGDNCGPPSAEEIRSEFERLSAIYPNAQIIASTMDAFAEQLIKIQHTLPIVTEEIGDSWIHGVATDPQKVSQYRELLRLRAKWLEENQFDTDSREFTDFSDNLMLIAEHTWGMDEKKWLTDFKHYAKADFTAARKRDRISADAVPDKYRYIGAFAMDELDLTSKDLYSNRAREKSYSLFEQSWLEQRGYVGQALEALSADKKREAIAALEAIRCVHVQEEEEGAELPAASRAIIPWTPCKLGKFEVVFGEDGSIAGLTDEKGKEWADASHRLGAFLYETLGVADYHDWFEKYVQDVDRHCAWADADFGKPGIENVKPQPARQGYKPVLTSLVCVGTNEEDKVTAMLEMPEMPVNCYGAPKKVTILYRFGKGEVSRIDVSLHWSGKEANRLPEATWFSFSPKVDNSNQWRMDKLGERISPLEVVKHGNRNLHAVHSGIYYDGADGKFAVQTLDAAVVAPGERKILLFDNRFGDLDNGFHFLLHNNVWGTNFPMWYEDDAYYRFTLTFETN
ncbi:DUF5054 domain-containing protein [Paenibacillus sp. GCM10027626]|uniref:DUF5054 domain-containing protein n=1 Tax=Paenibacillus sp. GCM10027626 TaxID=3273411 RepID=UPI00362DA4A4